LKSFPTVDIGVFGTTTKSLKYFKPTRSSRGYQAKKDYFEEDDEETAPNINNLQSSSNSPDKRGKSPTRKKMTVEFATIDSQKDDLLAQKIFDSFKNDLNQWWVEHPLHRNDEDMRGRVADDLTERYLSHKLDSMNATRTITHIRKSMADIIENFACDGILPPEISGQIVTTNKKKPITAVEIMRAKDEATRQANESYEKKREEEKEKMTGKDRETKEKNKIKEQYENYMRLKSKAVNHEDNVREKEIENHLNEIKSLISTFHTPT